MASEVLRIYRDSGGQENLIPLSCALKPVSKREFPLPSSYSILSTPIFPVGCATGIVIDVLLIQVDDEERKHRHAPWVYIHLTYLHEAARMHRCIS